jgi:catechol 2,3-dioxygenase-like lactoylglutathione lyase family enzyme
MCAFMTAGTNPEPIEEAIFVAQITTSFRTDKPLIPISMISHGTLLSVDLNETRRFLEEVLGFEVVQFNPNSMCVRKGTDHTYVILEMGPGHMQLLDHNGLDVPTREAVEEAHRVLTEVKDQYGVRRITPPKQQHGAYSFYFQDRDSNWWEIVQQKEGGYSFCFEESTRRDITDRTDIDADAMTGHILDDEVWETLKTAP